MSRCKYKICMKLVTSGKVKDIYDAGDNKLQFHFSDRVSAFDVKFDQTIPQKGKVLCAFAEFWFKTLGIENHFIDRVSETDIVVKKMQMIPLECVARGYLYGSLYDRYSSANTNLDLDDNLKLASVLQTPVFDPTTKSKHDMPVSKDDAIRMNLVDENTYNHLESKTLKIYKKMATISKSAGFIMVDLKLEWGTLDGEIVLGDSIGPDECRLWPSESYVPGKIQDAYDKQILRDWLTSNGHKERFEQERKASMEPAPPQIPAKIIEKITQRYLAAYTRITGNTT